MSDPFETVRGLFALAVSIVVLVVMYRAFSGGAIQPVVDLAADALPGFVAGLVFVFIALQILKTLQ